MPRLLNILPKYRHHRPSGQAVVTLNGRDFYLGVHGTRTSRQEYDRIVGEWQANGRRLSTDGASSDLTVTELIAAFWQHAEAYYRKPDGTPTSEIGVFKIALRVLRRMYGRNFVTDFGPRSLRAVQAEMVNLGWCRRSINGQVNRVRHVFKWGTAQELVRPDVYHGLLAVSGLKAGRSEAKESTAVLPVPEATVAATLPHLSRVVRAMVQVQLLTGMRPGEVCDMRGCDLDTTGKLWMYRPAEHKTQHHGHERVIMIGPRAQEIIQPFLKPGLQAFLFSPAEAEAERRAVIHATRITPLGYGNRPGTNRTGTPRRQPGACYTVDSYRRAIHRASAQADVWTKGGRVVSNAERFIASWHPHQLRHTAATNLRKEFGLEAAQVILGHKELTVTQLYAEKNLGAARRIMARVG